MQPIFIFSIPRSGSTLLQRILSRSESITSVSEPWILLPLLYMQRKENAESFTEYGASVAADAINDFIKSIPNGRKTFDKSITDFAISLYKAASSENTKYFLDKTPRYHLICSKIIDLFPNSKFIFLWRNPLSILASISIYFGNGKWRFHDYKIDLYYGLNNLYEAYTKNKEKSFSLNYENLLFSPKECVKELFEYLELPYKNEYLSSFNEVQLKGRMGDRSGTSNYNNISIDPLIKWKKVISNPLRIHWARCYLEWIGEKKLSKIGYNLNQLLIELDSVDVEYKWIINDVLRYIYGELNNILEIRLIKKKIKIYRKNKYDSFWHY